MEMQQGPYVRSAEGWRMPKAARGVRHILPKSNRYSARSTMVTPTDYLLPTESGLEANVALVSLARHDVRDIVSQAATIRFGDDDKHTFDFVEEMVDESRVAVMVKPSARADKRGTLDLLRTVAAQTPASIATRFVLATEKDISSIQVTNAKLIHSVRMFGPPPGDPAVASVALHVRGPITIGEAVRQSQTGSSGFRAAVRLIADGRLSVLSKGRINRHTLVEPAGAEEVRR